MRNGSFYRSSFFASTTYACMHRPCIVHGCAKAKRLAAAVAAQRRPCCIRAHQILQSTGLRAGHYTVHYFDKMKPGVSRRYRLDYVSGTVCWTTSDR